MELPYTVSQVESEEYKNWWRVKFHLPIAPHAITYPINGRPKDDHIARLACVAAKTYVDSQSDYIATLANGVATVTKKEALWGWPLNHVCVETRKDGE